MSRTFELSLRDITVLVNGYQQVVASTSVLSVTVTYPNPETPQRNTVKALKLSDGKGIDFTSTNPETGEAYTYGDRIVLKESVVGKSELVVEVATVHKTPAIEKFVASLFGTVFGGVWKLLIGGIANVVVGAVAQTVADAHAGAFALDDSTSYVVGRAVMPIDEASLSNGTVPCTLVVPDDVTIDRYTVAGGSQPRREQVTILKKGAKNGSLTLDCVVY